MTEATVMFGIGATKAGTSWLHRYLSTHPECHMPPVKELHYFDALDFGKAPQEAAQLRKRRDRIAGLHPDDTERLSRLDDWIAFLESGRENAAGYLAQLRNGAGQAKLVADITPAYSLLSEDRLRFMDRLAPSVRFVYLLRDPVDRLWSNIRMMASTKANGGAAVARKALHLFDRFLMDEEPGLDARSDYAGTLGRLSRAVRPANLLVEFSDHFFSAAGIARLCDFLGIGFQPGNTEKRVHEGLWIGEPDAARLQAARQRLAPQYDYVGRVFGKLPESWRHQMVEV